MANMVTREFRITKGTALVFDNDTNKVKEVPYRVVGNLTEKRLSKTFHTHPNETFIKLKSVEHEKILMGMRSDKFLEHAVELNPETRKPMSEHDQHDEPKVVSKVSVS